MVLEGAYDMFSGFVSMKIQGYYLVSDIKALLNDTLVFSADFVIDNLGVDLVVLLSEAVHYGVVG